ncbi:MAG: X-Pro dipeptidyl-peptidase, partial [Gemmatimonadaceae bacterium]
MLHVTRLSFIGLAFIIGGTAVSSPLSAQAPSPAGSSEVRAGYAKREVRIPMRDGTTLFTSIYTPRDTTRSYPILLMR